MQITSKLPHVGTNIFTVMSGLATEYGAINLSQGFPNFDPSPRLRQLVSEYMGRGANQYAPMPGLPVLRERIAAKMNGIDPRLGVHADEITVTAGATQAIFCAIAAFVHPGEEVILLEPCYDSYRPSVETVGGVAVPYALSAPDFRVDWAAVGALITPRTRMICVNTPCNPTGTVLDTADWDALAQLLEGTDIVLMSDEVYEHLIFDGRQHQSALSHPGLRERTVATYSFGKTFHNTGWKTGYTVATPALTKEFRKVHQFNVFSANHPMQAAFADFLSDASEYSGLEAFYQQKRDYLLAQMEGAALRPLACDGTYFQLFDYSALSDEPDRVFCERMVREAGVAAIPLSPFYSDGRDEHLIRICFAKTEDVLLEGARRLTAFG
jgi:methionine transaminase